MNDLFRSLFGLPRRGDGEGSFSHDGDSQSPGSGYFQDPFFRSQGPFFGNHEPSGPHGPGCTCDEDFQGEGHHEHGFPGDFHFSFHSGEADEMFRHFDDMFRSFDELFRGMGVAEFPSIEGQLPPSSTEDLPPGGTDEPDSLRDKMLKVPDFRVPAQPRVGEPGTVEPPGGAPGGHRHPLFDFFGSAPRRSGVKKEDKKDTDLDEQASAGAIEEMLRGRGSGRKANPEDLQPYSTQPDITSRFKSVSIQTVRRADGSVEERRTVRDGEGNEETTVTRSYAGNETPQGKTREDLMNTDEKDKPGVDERWQGYPFTRQQRPVPSQEEPDDSTKSIFKNIFGFDFSGFRKT